jgi:hypothetical protein
MKFPVAQVRENFIKDCMSGNFKTQELIKKYKFPNAQDYYLTTSMLRKKGLLPKSKLSESIKKYWAKKKAETQAPIQTKVTKDQPLSDFRTVYFKDFTVQIHKKAMARLVVDHNNNLHILNS